MARDIRELAGAWTRFQRHASHPPSGGLTRHVDHLWAASWHYPRPYHQLIVPLPQVHLVIQDGRATVNGVRTGHHVKVLAGVGGVLGVAFRPGGFRGFLRAPVSTITDRSVDAEAVFGADVRELLADWPAMVSPHPGEAPAPYGAETAARVDRFLLRRRPAPDQRAEQAAEMVAAIATRPEITRVDTLVRETGGTVRQAQRLFAEHVGVGPKWVIRRYRLREVTERMAAGGPIDWAALAADLGYTDQSHLVRDFRDVFGEPPTHYAARFPGFPPPTAADPVGRRR
ncbi:AraC family transcriptional regulator [Frankia sp. CNm7]|uniref:AraC family transcriptional regulator n=1 Tax=Frankia nepalensis TaxID=1836974 RepID=A0A937REM4_9ACTN|nr:helix-turn-helix domain-containing protein [Frankia nepalensis]MBL7498952.1 AraC family transcriptional regulator [Frankia nepalensis]MBL7511251.1 AraC family transcriptional regulator [Frankia nepalensis]MBL7520575.1 AraC family transcriptional regulator [Frankia nepalensis]MBL7630771.1 AraC family transcriptional regulator [Frankia nepalensis]